MSAEGNIGETQNSNGYVHKLDRLSELAKEDSKRQFFSKRGIPIVAAVFACRVLGCDTQELRVPFQNVFDAQENIPESRTAHQGCEAFPVAGDGLGHGLDEVVQLIQSCLDDGVAQPFEPAHVEP